MARQAVVQLDTSAAGAALEPAEEKAQCCTLRFLTHTTCTCETTRRIPYDMMMSTLICVGQVSVTEIITESPTDDSMDLPQAATMEHEGAHA